MRLAMHRGHRRHKHNMRRGHLPGLSLSLAQRKGSPFLQAPSTAHGQGTCTLPGGSPGGTRLGPWVCPYLLPSLGKDINITRSSHGGRETKAASRAAVPTSWAAHGCEVQSQPRLPPPHSCPLLLQCGVAAAGSASLAQAQRAWGNSLAGRERSPVLQERERRA